MYTGQLRPGAFTRPKPFIAPFPVDAGQNAFPFEGKGDRLRWMRWRDGEEKIIC